MKSFYELQKEHSKKVELLQKYCKHKKTKWYGLYWGIGHPTGREAKICLFCNKHLEERELK